MKKQIKWDRGELSRKGGVTIMMDLFNCKINEGRWKCENINKMK